MACCWPWPRRSTGCRRDLLEAWRPLLADGGKTFLEIAPGGTPSCLLRTKTRCHRRRERSPSSPRHSLRAVPSGAAVALFVDEPVGNLTAGHEYDVVAGEEEIEAACQDIGTVRDTHDMGMQGDGKYFRIAP